jgi:predicted RNA-binding Zn-ribbon protein involved in translation (DUF1610 family)
VEHDSPANPPDECYRCGYDLRGIADDHACPECGLLAQRSRRTTDELHNTRPRWLRSISRGTNLILLSLILTVAWWVISSSGALVRHYSSGWTIELTVAVACIISLLFIVGVWLLTRLEGYPPADRADRRLRVAVRIAAIPPVLAVALGSLFVEMIFRFNLNIFAPSNLEYLPLAAGILATIGTVPLPFLIFRRLRSLAQRARSAHLAEHCTIVGIGISAAWLCATIFIFLIDHPQFFGLAPA